jgi:hypothetical protein
VIIAFPRNAMEIVDSLVINREVYSEFEVKLLA